MMNKQLSSGTTPSERRLHELCQKSFLRLWSYSNVFRDQGRYRGHGHGKEVCDTIAIFDDRIILFSDKHCAYPNTGNPDLDWQRWYARAIEKSAEQLFGAERWLRQAPTRLYLDPDCTRPLPISLPPRGTKFYRIAVAMGAGLACRAYHGGSGSLIIEPGARRNSNVSQPFVIDEIDARGLVHVLDDFTLDVVLSHLDTIADFVEYLDWKEQLIQDNLLAVSMGEENLVGLFLSTKCAGLGLPERQSPDAKYVIADDLWDGVQQQEWFHALQRSYEVSYAWDRLIDHFAADVLNDEMLSFGSPSTPPDHEKRVRALARTSRVTRIGLAESLIEITAKVKPGELLARTALPQGRSDTGFILIVARSSSAPYSTYEEYRVHRQSMLRIYCLSLKSMRPELAHVVGVALDAEIMPDGMFLTRSEDVMYIGSEDWTESIQREARDLQAKTGVLNSVFRVMSPYSFQQVYEALQESDIQAQPAARKVGRNEPCPCGSGLKFKRCHGK
ncbi:YecA family protein [Sorangium sp. So ce406]|uniref:YecA family protein n=1 Tax=Sorangium sp. So ce406 TaxID=3133311 RepID=UPI003F5AFB30